MPQERFTQATEKPFALTNEERDKIDTALTKYLEMDTADRVVLIDDIERTGSFRQFGYGSLMGDPSSPPDKEFAGTLAGWERGAVCTDRYYRGVPGTLGVTMGAMPVDNPDAQLRGLVQVIDADTKGEGSFADRILHSIYSFAKRESSENPIYKYNVVDINAGDQGAVKALICAADSDAKSFLGSQPVLNDDGTVDGLSMEEAASIIATSQGAPGASIRNTGLSYWQFILHCTYAAGQEPEPHIKELVERAAYFRSLMSPEDRAPLEELENTGKEGHARAKYDPRAFNMSTDPDGGERFKWSRTHAGNVLKEINDPLSKERLKHIRAQKAELNELVLNI